MRALFPAFTLIAVQISAQSLDIGIKAGLRMTDDVSGYSLGQAQSKRYIVGPALGVWLPFRLGIEVDALYRTFGYSSGWSYENVSGYDIRERSNSWEFPVIGKFRPKLGRLKPVIGAGLNTRTVNGTRVSSGFYFGGPPPGMTIIVPSSRSSISYPVTHGLVVSGGLEWRILHIRISPEARYQRWNRSVLDTPGMNGSGNYDIHSTKNEASCC